MTSFADPSQIVFRGTDGNECENFISLIERLAYSEGWAHDEQRKLLFARSRLEHKALRWLAKLDPGKKADWNSFVEALFDHYPLIEDESVIGTATPVWSATTFSPETTATTLPTDHLHIPDGSHVISTCAVSGVTPRSRRVYDPSLTGIHSGILRIQVEDTNSSPLYVCRGYRHCAAIPSQVFLRATLDVEEALSVCFIPGPSPHPIGCLNAIYGFKDLAVYYRQRNDQLNSPRGTPRLPLISPLAHARCSS